MPAGSDGDDLLSGKAGGETLDGGAGNDTASYAQATTGVIANLASGTVGYAPRIMPLGDSITFGVQSETAGGYRGPLWDRTVAGDLAINFVGSGVGGVIEDPDNEGHPGWTIDQMDANVATWIPAANPDIVLLIAGTNNTKGNPLPTASQILGKLSRLIDDIAAQPNAPTLFIGPIPPMTADQPASRIALAQAYNALIPDLIAQKRAAGIDVTYVDMSDLTPADITAPPHDPGLHPNPSGYQKIAADWYQALLTRLAGDNGALSATAPDHLISIENLEGSAYRDVLIGDGGANRLVGLGGGDLLNGGSGADTMIGGLGDDTYYVDDSGDQVVELAGQGRDTVRTIFTSVTLAANIENLTFVGSGDFAGTGNDLANLMTGGSGADTLSGGLDAANDTLVGGAGDDLYLVRTGDVVTEMAGAGRDRVQTDVATYILGSNVEELVYTGSAAFKGWGNASNNLITGGVGDDALNGLAGADTLQGGAGADSYTVDDVGDVVSEIDPLSGGDAGGTDTVKTTLTSYTLGNYIEKLTYLGLDPSVGFQGTGNDLLNKITGGPGADTLSGGADKFKDALLGGAGDDTYIVLVGDIVTENADAGRDQVQTALSSYALPVNVEELVFTGVGAFNGGGNDSNNLIVGGADADTFVGGLGADTITGGGGIDTIQGSRSELNGDVITDYGGDKIVLNQSLASPANVQLDTTGPNTLLKIDGNNDGTFETVITLQGALPGQLVVESASGLNNNVISLSGPSLSVAATNATRPEGNSGSTAFTFTVTRSGDLSGAAAADWAVSGSGASPADAADFGGALPSGHVSFAAGESSKLITVNVSGDTAFELDEGFTVALSNPSGVAITQASAAGAITNDDTAASSLSLAATSASRLEGDSGSTAFTFTVTRSGNLSGAATADWTVSGSGAASADAADFGGALPSGQVSFAAGESSKLITVNVAGDIALESDEGFTVTLSNATGGTAISQPTAVGSILNDDTFTLGTSGDDLLNGGAAADTIQGLAGNDKIFGNAGDDVLDGGDGADIISAGDQNDFVRGGAGDDVLKGNNGNDTLVGDGGADTLTGSSGLDVFRYESLDASIDVITDFSGNDRIELDLAGLGVTGGQVLFVNGLGATAAGVAALHYTVSNGALYLDLNGGDAADAVQFATLSNKYTLTQSLFSFINGGAPPPSLSLAATNASQAEGNSGSTAFTFTVTRSGDLSGATTVDWAASGSGTSPADGADFGGALPSGQVSFAAGESSKLITVNVAGDTTFESNEGFAVTLSNPSGGSAITQASAAGSITNDDALPSLSLAATSASQAEGNSGSTAFTFTVTRSGDLSGAATVDWAASGSGTSPADAVDFGGALPSGQVSFAAGESSKLITLNVAGDTAFESNEGFTVTLSNPSGGSAITQASAAGSITNDDAAPSSLSLAATSASQAEGNSGSTAFTFTVTRSGDLSGAATADWAASGSGTSPADAADFGGALPSGQVSFAAGESSKLITVNVAGDTAFEPDEGLTLTLSNPSGAAITQATASGSILNDDAFVLLGTSGDDLLNGGAAADTIQGLAGNDKIFGNAGDDVLDGGDGADIVSAGDQNDFVRGGAGDDVLKGNNDNDTLVGGSGLDTLTGSSGLDVFRFESLDASIDVITDFSGNDRIELDLAGLGVTGGQVLFVNGLGATAAGVAALHYTVSNGALYLDLNGGDAADAVQFATLSNKYTLTQSLFSFMNGGAAVPALSLAATNASQAEGNSGSTAFTFTVTRSGDLSGATTVDWAASGLGTSPADAADFGGALPSGQVSFAAGESSKLITLNVAGDTAFESNEGFTVTLSNPSGAAITQATASGSITNDDALPSLSLAATSASQAEGNSGSTAFTFTVTRSGDLSGATTADWAASGSGTSPADAVDFGGALPSGQVSFAAGESSKLITLNVAGDTALESNEGFTVTLSNPSGAAITQAAANGSITNDDALPSLSLAATNASQAEGNSGSTAFTFTVTRSGDLSGATTVDWAASGSGASPADGADFGGALPSGQVSFAAGESSKLITLNVAGDTTLEPDEGFTLTLSNPSGESAITQATASGSITNDDVAPPSLSLAATNASQAEGNSGSTAFTFTVTRSGDLSGATTVDWAASGSGTSPADAADFGGALPSGQVSFAAGESSKLITLNVAGDTTLEPDEGFTLTLSNPSGAAITQATASGSILNDDVAPPSLSLAATNASQAEGDSGSTAFTFTVTRSGDLSGATTADWAASGSGTSPADAADFGGALPSGQVSFAAGESSKLITLNVAGDTAFESTEGFTVTLSNPSGGSAITQASAAGSITNDDAAPSSLSLAATSASQSEGNSGSTAFTFTVTRSGDLSGAATADWAASGSGTSPADAADFGGALPSGQVSFAAGESSKLITVNVAGDTAFEPDDGFTLTLSNPSGAAITQATASGSILNDDVAPPSLSLAATNASQAEGNSGSTAFTFTVTRSGDLSGATTVDWAASGSGASPADGADFGGALPSGQVSFAAGESSKLITLNVAGDTTLEPDEGFTLTLSNPSGGSAITQATASGSITNDDVAPPSLSLAATNASQAEGNSGSTAFTFTVTRSGDLSGAATADWAASGSGTSPADAADFGGALPSGQVSFAAGESSKLITLNVAGDTAFESTEGFTVTLSNPSGAPITQATASGSITNDDALPSLSLAATNASQAEGNSGSTAFTFTVTRSGDLSGAATADWAASGSGTSPADAADFGGALPSGQVSFAAGESSKLITVNVAGDTTFESNEGFTVTLSNPSGAAITQASAVGSITNDDAFVLLGTSGDDLLNGGATADTIQGLAGNDKIFGNAGDDVLDGGDGADIVSGGDQNDFVRGGAGDDVLKGNNDNDTLVGGSGLDTLTGSSGLDVFRFESLDTSIDVITDFSGNDRIELDLAGLGVTGGQVLFVNGLGATAAGVAALHYTVSNGALYLDLNGGDAADAVQFATLSNKYAISQGLFLLT